MEARPNQHLIATGKWVGNTNRYSTCKRKWW